MKVLLLSEITSIHTKRWADSLSKAGIQVCVFSLFKNESERPSSLYEVVSVSLPQRSRQERIDDGSFSKLRYLTAVSKLKQVIKSYKPDIIHAHYASSYGLLGALAFKHPYVVSVWGSDILLFPKVSFIHRSVIKFVFRKADYLFSTSRNMANEGSRYTDKPFKVIPFGIDCHVFRPERKQHKVFTIGCTKNLLPIYGIDKLIRAFAIVCKTIQAKLVLVGDGPEREHLMALAQSLNVQDKVSFEGNHNHDEMMRYYNEFDVAVFLSESESFGVVALEAMACECPLIVSHTLGFDEVVPNEAGLFVDRSNEKEIASRILYLHDNPQIGNDMGRSGRHYVQKKYSWEENVRQMIEQYNTIATNG